MLARYCAALLESAPEKTKLPLQSSMPWVHSFMLETVIALPTGVPYHRRMIETLIDFKNVEKGRWYRLETGTDLFGQKLIVKRWGSLHSRRGSQSVMPILPDMNRLKVLKAELRRRFRHGYS